MWTRSEIWPRFRSFSSNVAAAARLRMAGDTLSGRSVVKIHSAGFFSIGSFKTSWAGPVNWWNSFRMMTLRLPTNGMLADISASSRAESTPFSPEALISCKPSPSAPASPATIKASVVLPHPGGP